MKNLSNTEAELKKSVAYKKTYLLTRVVKNNNFFLALNQKNYCNFQSWLLVF